MTIVASMRIDSTVTQMVRAGMARALRKPPGERTLV